MTAPAVKISLKTGIHIVWNFTFVTHYIAFLHFDSIIIKFVLNLAVFILTYSMLLQVQIYIHLYTHTNEFHVPFVSSLRPRNWCGVYDQKRGMR